jgi:polyisoprenoid-binding protein YceI
MKIALRLALGLSVLAVGATTLSASPAEPTRMRIDKNHSSVTFKVPILGGLSTVTGKFMAWEVEVMGVDGRSIGFKATAVLGRRDFGIDWQHSSVPSFAANDIVVELFVLASTPQEEGS